MQVANIIFIDAPVGTGFSYAKSWEEYPNLNDTISAAQTYQFLKKVRNLINTIFLLMRVVLSIKIAYIPIFLVIKVGSKTDMGTLLCFTVGAVACGSPQVPL